MAAIKRTHDLQNNTTTLTAEWSIDIDHEDFETGKNYYSEPFPKDPGRNQFRLKLQILEGSSFKLSFSVWKADFTHLSSPIPKPIILNVTNCKYETNPPETFQLGTPEVKNKEVFDIHANKWYLITKYSIKHPNTVNRIYVLLEFTYNERKPMAPETGADFKELLNDSSHADITITASDGLQRSAHRLVLMARSKVFQAMFEHNLSEKEQSQIQMTDINGAVLDHFLQFLYLGHIINMETCDVEALLMLADKYDLPALKLLTQEHMFKKLNEDNAAKTLSLAVLYKAAILEKFCLIFIQEKGISSIMQTESYKNLAENNVLDVCRAIMEFVYRK